MLEEANNLPACENVELEPVDTALSGPVEEGLSVPKETTPDESENNSVLTKEQQDALEMIRALAPKAVQKLSELLDRDDVKPAVKIRICEIILDRTYGRPESSVRVTSVAQSVTQSREQVLTLIQSVRETVLVEEVKIRKNENLFDDVAASGAGG